jgi:hypothetical protein
MPLTQNRVLGDSMSPIQMVLAHMLRVKDGFMPGILLMLNGILSVFKDHIITPGISPVLKILKVVKYARTTSQFLMSMATLAPHTMNLTQTVAETMTLKNSLPPENAASVEVEAQETIAQTSPGTCTSPMMRLMVMP